MSKKSNTHKKPVALLSIVNKKREDYINGITQTDSFQ